MGGSNPYISQEEPELPQKKFKITFLPMNVTVEVDPEEIPYGVTGRPGSILDVALTHGINVDHACGGVAACSTCHCIVKKGGSTLSEATSWGKVSKQATHEMAFVETSVALPLLYGYALQKNAAAGRKRLAFAWDADILKSVKRV